MLPGYVKDDAGHLEPFEPDRLYRRLFAATEAAGYADPLAARELTDSVLHFLSRDGVGLIVEHADLALRVKTVLRELRHSPVVAALSASGSVATPAKWSFPVTAPLTLDEECQPTYRGYGRALALAQEQGLLTLDAVGDADSLAGLVIRLPAPGTAGLTFIEQARESVGQRLILDSPDLDGVLQGWKPEALTEFLREVAWASAIHGLTVACHLNLAEPPAWGELAAGPLFRQQVDPVDVRHREALAEATLRSAHQCQERLWSGLEVVWHSSAERTTTFGSGLGRRAPALLMVTDLHLPVLAERQTGPLTPERFIGKVQSLARLAASAATKKQQRLRQELRAEAAYAVEASHAHLRLCGLEVMEDLASFRRRLKRTLKEEGQLRSLPFTFELMA